MEPLEYRCELAFLGLEIPLGGPQVDVAEKPGDVDVFRIEGKAGDEIVVEVLARQLGSPLDSLEDSAPESPNPDNPNYDMAGRWRRRLPGFISWEDEANKEG